MTLAEMRRCYEGGWTARQIADESGVAESTVRYRLRAAGVRIRPRARPVGSTLVSTEEMARSVALSLELGTPAAALELGICEQTLRHRIRRSGALPRSGNRTVAPIPHGHVDVHQAADRLGCCRQTVIDRCNRGQMLGAEREQRWPHRWLIPTAELDRHERLQALTTTTNGASA